MAEVDVMASVLPFLSVGQVSEGLKRARANSRGFDVGSSQRAEVQNIFES